VVKDKNGSWMEEKGNLKEKHRRNSFVADCSILCFSIDRLGYGIRNGRRESYGLVSMGMDRLLFPPKGLTVSVPKPGEEIEEQSDFAMSIR
jgi:hypothetical protein